MAMARAVARAVTRAVVRAVAVTRAVVVAVAVMVPVAVAVGIVVGVWLRSWSRLWWTTAAVATAAVAALCWVGAMAVAVARVRMVARGVARVEERAVARVVAVRGVVARCIVFSLTATGIRGNVVCHATLTIGVAIFHQATSAIHSVVICCSTMAMHGGHNNQQKEGLTEKMPVTEAKQQATTSWRDKRTRGRRNTNVGAMTAMGMMTTATMIVPTIMTMTTTSAAAASIKRYTMCLARWLNKVPS
jgi:hypothetical protein